MTKIFGITADPYAPPPRKSSVSENVGRVIISEHMARSFIGLEPCPKSRFPEATEEELKEIMRKRN